MKIEPGMRVRYHAVIGRPHDGEIYTVFQTAAMGDGSEVAWLKGKPGCVSVDALSPITNERHGIDMSDTWRVDQAVRHGIIGLRVLHPAEQRKYIMAVLEEWLEMQEKS